MREKIAAGVTAHPLTPYAASEKLRTRIQSFPC